MPDHLSYSQIHQLRTCGESYRLSRVEGWPKRPSVPAVAGQIIHTATEAVDKAILAVLAAGDNRPLNYDDRDQLTNIGEAAATEAAKTAIPGACNDEFPTVDTWKRFGRKTVEKPNAEDMQWFLDVGIPNAVAAYVDWRLAHPELTLDTIPGFGPAIEVPFAYQLNGQLIVGFIDRVFQHNGEGHYPVDLKGLDVNTPIPTPTGWATMASLRVGDAVFGSNGEPCTITAKSTPRQIDCYRLLFDDGTSLVCDAEHLWETTTGASAPGARRSTAVRSVAEIRRTIRDAEQRRMHRIRLAEPLSLDAVDLPIDPYVLGVWLGDGKAMGASFCKASADSPIADEIRRRGFEVRAWKPNPSKPNTTDWNVLGLQSLLRKHGLLGNKHIPAAYLRGSIAQRLDLLRGLMDTDGTYNTARRSVAFTSTDKSLREGVAEMALSLGERVYRFDIERTGFGKTVTSHDVRWTPTNYNPFSLPRKADQVLMRRHGKSRRRMIVSIEPTITVPTQCIAVDSPDSTYLAGEDFVVTHNSGLKPKTDEQLGLYARALHSALGWEPTYGFFLYGLKKGEAQMTPPLSLAHWTEQKLDRVYLGAKVQIESGIFIPSPGEACFICDVQYACEFARAVI